MELKHELDTPVGVVELYTSESMVFSTDARGIPNAMRFYTALNLSLARDKFSCLNAAMPYIVKLLQFIMEERHPGGMVYSGTQLTETKPADLAKVCGVMLRIPKFLSTSSDRAGGH